MKTMHGAFCSACADRARGADADEHLDELGSAQAEERHLGLAGHRAGEQRLAGAGRADQQHAFGIFPPRLVNLRGFFRNSTISRSSCAASSTPATSWNVVFDVVFRVDFGLAARERHHAAFRAANAAEEKRPPQTRR